MHLSNVQDSIRFHDPFLGRQSTTTAEQRDSSVQDTTHQAVHTTSFRAFNLTILHISSAEKDHVTTPRVVPTHLLLSLALVTAADTTRPYRCPRCPCWVGANSGDTIILSILSLPEKGPCVRFIALRHRHCTFSRFGNRLTALKCF